MKFTSEIKTKWLEELRSGNNQQVKGTLKGEFKDGVGYCCLGVLEEKVLGKELETTVWAIEFEDYFDEGNVDVYIMLRKLLSDDVVNSLTIFNDDKGWTFQEIANWIEEKVEVSC